MNSAKTIVITGANAGTGLATTTGLASKGHTISRDAKKGTEIIAKLKSMNADLHAENFTADLANLML